MVKAERGSTKDIGNRIKAKGLQKLKFFCQMCEKQCRDANGFKCHLTSESHLRQMKIFSDNAGGILDKYSKEFVTSYMQTLRLRHGTKKVNANNVYQELISDKEHIHMNATHWTTLTDFVQYLGKTGKCVVEETERGWDVSYIERDVSTLARNEALQRRELSEKAAEEAQTQRMVIQRIEAAKALDRAGGTLHTEATAIEKTGDKPIKVALSGNSAAKKASKPKQVAAVFGDDNDDDNEEEDAPKLRAPSLAPPSTTLNKHNSNKKKRPPSDRTVESFEAPKRAKTTTERKEYWLYRDIIVRVICKKFDRKYFKRKAIVDRLIDKYTADVEILDSSNDAKDGGDILRLDQADLETVIPKEAGKKVRILNGRYRGEKATVVDLNKIDYVGVLKLRDGTIVEKVPYEDFSKLA
jgi:DNA/RNA-binding protein KIN17